MSDDDATQFIIEWATSIVVGAAKELAGIYEQQGGGAQGGMIRDAIAVLDPDLPEDARNRMIQNLIDGPHFPPELPGS